MTRWQRFRTVFVAHRSLKEAVERGQAWKATATAAIDQNRTLRAELDAAHDEAARWCTKWAEANDQRRAALKQLREQELLLQALGEDHIAGHEPTTERSPDGPSH